MDQNFYVQSHNTCLSCTPCPMPGTNITSKKPKKKQHSHCVLDQILVKSPSPLILLINQDKVDFLLKIGPPKADGESDKDLYKIYIKNHGKYYRGF